MSRMPVLCTVLLLMLSGCHVDRQSKIAPALAPGLWHDFAQRFVDNGRVVDTDNGGISHSEGQGYAMLFAEAADDREGFDSLWQWTRQHLKRDDGLLSWKWQPASGVADHNNASDGEILVAWALLRAAKRWPNEDYRREALSLLAAIRENLLIEAGGRLYLLPGKDGFNKPEDGLLILNPSYYIFPALRAFAAQEGGAIWQQVIDDGVSLLEQAAIAPSALVPDWVALSDGKVRIADGFPPRFSWDAVRVPLYVAWDRALPATLLTAYVQFWEHFEQSPAWIDLANGDTADFTASGGVVAVAMLSKSALNHTPRPQLPAADLEDGYYSSALILLATLAAAERWGTSP